MTNSIQLNDVSIDFPLYQLNTRSLKNRFLRRFLTGGNILKNQENVFTVRALDHISLHIEHGDRIGLIGPNGSGKSTLLRVLAGIYEPTQGSIQVNGKVSPLLDISVGINAEASGYENIRIQSALLGINKAQMNNQLADIIAFTELGDYLLLPIHTYSSGMKLRLAFAVATSIAPEILVMDEVIGVGDSAFIKKAQARMNTLIAQSGIVVLASHSTDILSQLCNKVIFLQGGKITYFGPIKEGIECYKQSLA